MGNVWEISRETLIFIYSQIYGFSGFFGSGGLDLQFYQSLGTIEATRIRLSCNFPKYPTHKPSQIFVNPLPNHGLWGVFNFRKKVLVGCTSVRFCLGRLQRKWLFASVDRCPTSGQMAIDGMPKKRKTDLSKTSTPEHDYIYWIHWGWYQIWETPSISI